MARRRERNQWWRATVGVAVVSGVVLAGAVLAGCGGGQTAQTRGELTVYVHGGSLLPRGGEDALIEGVLVARDGCVLVQGDLGDARPVIWPSGTVLIDDEPLTLRLASGRHVGAGQRVSGGGGSHAASSDRVEVDLDEACLQRDDQVLVFNPDEPLTIG